MNHLRLPPEGLIVYPQRMGWKQYYDGDKTMIVI